MSVTLGDYQRNIKIDLKNMDFDDQARVVKGYLSSFDVVDYGKDIIRRGAFSKTIQERFPTNNIKFLFNHKADEPPIGRFLDLHEDEFGLHYTAKMSKVGMGAIVYEQIKAGELDQHSIGFDIIKENFIEQDVREITEIRLWEGSVVTFGMNPATPITDVKSLQKEFSKLERMLNVKDISPEAYKEFEAQYLKLGETLEAVKQHFEPKETKDQVLSAELEEIKKLLKG